MIINTIQKFNKKKFPSFKPNSIYVLPPKKCDSQHPIDLLYIERVKKLKENH